jgi:hypothetical protein
MSETAETKRKIVGVANAIEALLIERLDGPRDAAKALLIAHVVLTQNQRFGRAQVNSMLTEYRKMFREAYFGAEQ